VRASAVGLSSISMGTSLPMATPPSADQDAARRKYLSGSSPISPGQQILGMLAPSLRQADLDLNRLRYRQIFDRPALTYALQ
jgi:hypothetical protein